MSYEDCIFDTMCKGGDTDTNGAIVGGMLGAYFGREALPKDMVSKVLQCDLQQGSNANRPDEC